ncbi:hypothetical protein [Streptomyces buecherae]|uniref:hypothetical protein n=1 Tax=Streptomyces buecherae TaxID=2763006 RepID=UPI003790684C
MTATQILALAGSLSAVISAYVMLWAAFRVQTAQVWRQEAEAQKVRADRLQDDLAEIKERLTRIEAENARLIQLLTALDPQAVARLPR